MVSRIEVGNQVFLADGGDEIGAVREVRRKSLEIVVFVENAGDFVVSGKAIRAVHDGKVVLEAQKLEADLLHAIRHAHDAEEPGR